MSEGQDCFAAFGIYRIGTEPNTLEADWAWSRQDHDVLCNGIASANSANGFEGEFVVVYQDADGIDGAAYKLQIDRSGSIFRLKWLKDDALLYHGIGTLHGDELVFGWGPVRA